MKVKRRSTSGECSLRNLLRFEGGIPKRLCELRNKCQEERGWSKDLTFLGFSILTQIPSVEWEDFEKGEKDFPIKRLIQVCLTTKTDPNWILFGDDKRAWQQTRGPWARQRSDGVTEIYSDQSKPKSRRSVQKGEGHEA